MQRIVAAAKATPGCDLHAPYYGKPEYDPQPNTPLEETFRHSGWAARRLRVFETMASFSTAPRQQAFAECGANLWGQVCAADGSVRLVANCCHDRFCVPCATVRARRIQANLSPIVAARPCRFVTLTLRASETPLLDQLRRLYLSFAMLRRRDFWKTNVIGGAAFCEVKIGERSGLWHVHLHVICEGSYIPQRELSMEWHAVTGDSSIVDVRAVKDPETAAFYVTKYVTKPASAEVFADKARLQELMISLKGRRMILPFGTWHKLKLTDIPSDGREWKSVMSIDQMILRAADGDPEGIRWFTVFRRNYPHLPWPSLDLPPPPDPNQLDLPGL